MTLTVGTHLSIALSSVFSCLPSERPLTKGERNQYTPSSSVSIDWGRDSRGQLPLLPLSQSYCPSALLSAVLCCVVYARLPAYDCAKDEL